MNGETIRNLRKWLNLTQEEFAELLNISSNYISKLERDIEIPSSKLVLNIMKIVVQKLEKDNQCKESLLALFSQYPILRGHIISYLIDNVPNENQNKLLKIIFNLIDILK